MLLKRHLEVEPSLGHLKILENWHRGKEGASAPHIQRYLPIVMGQNQRCCTKKYPAGGEKFRDFHSQKQFSLNKPHFPNEKSTNF